MRRLVLHAGDVAYSAISCAASAKRRSSILISSDPSCTLTEYLSEIGKVGYSATMLTDNFYAMEFNLQNEIEYRWKEFESLLSLIPGISFKDTSTEEVALLPGMDTVALLLKLDEITREKKYEYVQIHFPSYEKMLDFVVLPLNGEWYYQISSPGIINMLKLAKLARTFIKMPDPELVFSKINEYHSKLEKIEKILMDTDSTSARFDINPRFQNAGKTFFAYLSLFGINVDGVFTKKDFDFASKRFVLKEFSDQAYEKPKNIEELASKAKEVFDDPAEIFRRSKPVRFDRNMLEIQLEYGKASDMSVYQSKNQLAIRYKKLKRTLNLPEQVKGKNVENAKFSEGIFTITFS